MSEIIIPEEIKSMPFEQALSELETLVAKMENGGLTLEELMSGFERGRQLSTCCRNKLAALERKIEILSKDDGYAGKWNDFNPGNTRNAPPSGHEAAPANDNSELPF